jgi:peptide/nickel transport system ATP-binding protein
LTREALQAHATAKDYTRNLLTASEGFTRDPALRR